MEPSPYLLLEKVGPWEDDIRNPFMGKSSRGTTPENKKTSISEGKTKQKLFEKLPFMQTNIKRTLIPDKKSNTNKEKNQTVFQDKKQFFFEKTKRNFLVPRKKQNTIHMQDLQKKMRSFDSSPNDAKLENPRENNPKSEYDLKPVLKILAQNPFKLKIKEKIESPSKRIEKNSEYFTPNMMDLKKTMKQQKRKESINLQNSGDIYVKGALMNINNSTKNIRFSLHQEKKNNYSSKFNENNGKNLRDEMIKIKIEHLRKIEKNSTHFLKYFLLKYDEDVEKKKKFIHPKHQ